MTAPDPTVRHLYVHVPFCPTICPYCDFHVLTRRAGVVERYLEGIEAEAARLAAEYAVDLGTVYLGGGTPSFLRDGELEALVGSVRRHLGWGREENTLEVNPGTVSPGRASHWRSLGFDRASVGVQSLDDATLKFLGRQHSAAQAREAVGTLVGAGFRVSGDLITAVPGQPLEADIRGLVDLGVGHVSAYTLTIEPGTEFARRGVTVEEDDEREGFEQTEALLTSLGFTRYEVSNYARPGQESRHNLAYWHNRPYLGLGPGAAGHYPAARTRGVASPDDMSGVEESGSRGAEQGPGAPSTSRPLDLRAPLLSRRWTNPHLHGWLAGEAPDVQDVDAHEFVTDALFMGLRLRDGVNLAELSGRAGLDVPATYAVPIAANVRRGLLTLEGGRLRATPQGWWALNRVVAEFLEGMHA